MSSTNQRRRERTSESSSSERSSSLWTAFWMIAGVFGLAVLASLVFLMLPTASDRTRQKLAELVAAQRVHEATAPDVTTPTADPTEGRSPAPLKWIAELPYGTHGSPRLFRDSQHAEMVITFGDEKKRVGGAMGIDIVTGEARWQIKSDDEMFTLPVPLEPWPSGELPYVVGGRNGQLYAVDARTGKVLWKFQPSGEEGRGQGVYNYFTGRPVRDIDGDGVGDYLIPNGGDSRRNRFQPRLPGHLFLISGATGTLIHQVQVPDGRETYLSPLVWDRGTETLFVFGTGGETFPGSLWTVPLENVLEGSLDGVQVVVPNTDLKGAIPPPSFADLDRDGVQDLITAPFDGRMVVMSGRTMSTLWQFTPTGVQETQCSPTIADFDGDGDLDVAYITQYGVFPRWNASHVRVFDGLSGQLLWEHVIRENLASATPLALDLDADGRDELCFIHANPALFRPSAGGKSFSHLQIAHVDEGRIEDVGYVDGFNAGSGWIGDADRDGQLEWYVPLKLDGGTGRLVRIDLQRPAPKHIPWGGYLGTHHDGIYHVETDVEDARRK